MLICPLYKAREIGATKQELKNGVKGAQEGCTA